MNYIIIRKESLTFSVLTNTCDWGKYVTAEYFGKFKEVEKCKEKNNNNNKKKLGFHKASWELFHRK